MGKDFESKVVEIEFSRSTYQIGVFDSKTETKVWVFLQFDEEALLKDAFCSCEEEDVCPHMAVAFLSVYNGEKDPLHIRFEHSFWNILCKKFAAHFNYEGALSGTAENVSYSLKPKGRQAKDAFNHLLENSFNETPETSLKFSNLTQEEIAHWKEGRPNEQLRYELSFWSDFAKWMMLAQARDVDYEVTFDEETLLNLSITFPSFQGKFTYLMEDLLEIIQTIGSVNANLKLFASIEKTKIRFDSKKKKFLVSYEDEEKKEGEKIGEWSYVKGEGFYPARPPLPLNELSVSGALENYSEAIANFYEVDKTPLPLHYDLHFDKSWNLHISSYLFEKGDIDENFFQQWAYVEGKGFFALQPLFEEAHIKILEKDVDHFIHKYRGWLTQQPGFLLHLSTYETTLSYQVTKEGTLSFFTPQETQNTHDFGEWIYVEGQGFFSKRSAFSFSIPQGLEVKRDEIASFIRSHQEELENILGFFSISSPILHCGLNIYRKTQNSIEIQPECRLLPELEGKFFQIFGEFIFVEGMGFSLIPLPWRIREAYKEGKIIHEKELPFFFKEEFPKLDASILYLDPTLKIPSHCTVEVFGLKQEEEGFSGKFFYKTELGRVSLNEIFDAMQQNKRFLFSEAGRIDLYDERLSWTQQIQIENEGKIKIPTIDFFRLDLVEGVFAEENESRTLLEELRHFVYTEKPILKGLKSELRLYQKTGLEWLWFLYLSGLSGILCDDMGLGKTHQAMALMAAARNHKKKGLYLVVAPTSVIYHWQDKLKDFLPELKVHFFYGLKRSLKRVPKEGVVLTSYGVLRMEKEALEKLDFEIAVFDELQVAKNPLSQVHASLLKLKAKMRLGLSGTPIENNLRELKSLFDIVLPGYMPQESRFRDDFIIPIEREGNSEKKMLLSKLIRPFILRRKKKEVLQELPEKTEDKNYAILSDVQEKLYRETLERQRSTLLSDLEKGVTPIPYVHIFSILTKLKQICDHPALFYKDQKNYKEYPSGKWDLFVELLSEALEGEQKVVVFSQYLGMLDIIESYLQEQGINYAQIRGETRDRRGEMERFQNDPRCQVFIGTLQAAGLGIDLTAASIVILYDRWWNAARENQAIDRVHRIGQKWGVQVYKLITKGTVEEKIDHLITRKGQLLEDIVASDDETQIKRLTREELIQILSF